MLFLYAVMFVTSTSIIVQACGISVLLLCILAAMAFLTPVTGISISPADRAGAGACFAVVSALVALFEQQPAPVLPISASFPNQ